MCADLSSTDLLIENSWRFSISLVVSSMHSAISLQKFAKHSAKLMTDEAGGSKIRKVDIEMYMVWMRATGGLWIVIPLFLAFLLPRIVEVVAVDSMNSFGSSGELDESSDLYSLGILALLYLVLVFITFFKQLLPLFLRLKASKAVSFLHVIELIIL